MKLHVLLATVLSVNAAKDITLITFDGAEPTTHLWRASNDPIMGGKSTGTFEIKNHLGVFDGEVVDVPFLKAPGFIRALARDLKRYPDISSCKALVLSAATKTPSYGGFRFSFGLAHPVNGTEFAYGYKANFKATSPTIADIKMPFGTFSDYWSDATGKAIKTCADDKRYCPTKLALRDVATVAVWAEGVAGKVHLEMKSLRATDCGTGPSPAPPAEKNIVELAEADKDLSTLVTALKAGNLTGALSGKGPFTVFAPTNEAFGKLPAGMLKTLLEPAHIKELDAVLEYHVIAGAAVHSKDLKPTQTVKSLEGDDLLIEVMENKYVFINRKSRVLHADLEATNGVVHIVDNVLIPDGNAQ